MKPFHGGKKRGQRVKYLANNGIGRHGSEYKVATGTVALVYDDRLVVDAGGRHGRPVVVTEKTFVS